ncbi:hypothetical protein AB0J90_25505 [Micromonospora sp. NPDC049523]
MRQAREDVGSLLKRLGSPPWVQEWEGAEREALTWAGGLVRSTP